MNIGLTELLLMPISMILPLVALYFVVKSAVKNAIKELKNEGEL